MKVKIKLVVLSTIYSKQNEVQVLSCNKDSLECPYHDWDNLEKITLEYTNLSYNWFNPKLFDVLEIKRGEELDIIYYACLPEDTELTNGHWVSLYTTDGPDRPLAMKIGNLI